MIDRLADYQRRLSAYYEAETAILAGAQSYQIGTRNLTRADLGEVREAIEYLVNRIEVEESRISGKGRNKVVGGVPRDV